MNTRFIYNFPLFHFFAIFTNNKVILWDRSFESFCIMCIGGLSWRNCFILITVEKIAPLILISYIINFNLFFIFIIIELPLMCIMLVIGRIHTINRKLINFFSSNFFTQWELNEYVDILILCRPQWSQGNVLASRSEVRRFKPGWGRWVFFRT